ncbi:hypothetical protein L1281_001720 [Neisseria sp. HSC-16F19]|nr:hypothetical protein [Neisseria sp. HSC-16F19]MCP2041126.1 hypothetical protein [Neisseria sp. HSC-16F19]
MINEIRDYVLSLLSRYDEFGVSAMEDYRVFLEDAPETQNTHSISGIFRPVWHGGQDSHSERPTDWTEVLIYEDASPEEEGFIFEINGHEAGEARETYFLQVYLTPDNDGRYACDWRYSGNQGETELKHVAGFHELRELLHEFEQTLAF